MTVIILCGGRGSRLQPITADVPKALVPLHGKPILQHSIEFYLSKQVTRFILCTGVHAGAIERFLASHGFPAEIQTSNAGEEVSMLQRLYAVRYLMEESRAIVTYGDTFIDLDPQKMLAEHRRSGAAVTMTVAEIRSPFGLVTLGTDQSVLAFEEKPLLPHYIGQFIIERSVFDQMDDAWLALPDGEGLVRLFQDLIEQKRLRAYQHRGLHLTFNTMEERQRAEAAMVTFFTEQAS